MTSAKGTTAYKASELGLQEAAQAYSQADQKDDNATASLLGKMLGEIRRQMRIHSDEELLNDKQLDMLETITRVYRQQKNHYGLRKIAARIKSTEILLIFFGIHTANVVILARRESVQVALAA